jgi:hypothetical protein
MGAANRETELKTDLEEKLIKGVVILKVQVFLEG